MTKKLLGYAAVDSGMLLICDPAYLSNWVDGPYDPDQKGKPKNSYDKVCRITVGVGNNGGQVNISGKAGDGVVFASGYGDGNYPCYGTFNKDGRCMKVEIDMK